jgi:HK97 gp10 family phage protein
MKVTWKLDGVPGLISVLNLAGQTARAEVGAHNQQTARALQVLARSKVRRDRGDLAAAIAVAGGGLTWRVGLEDKSVGSRGGRNSAHLNPSVYGVFVEYGTKRMPASPFMRPAVDQIQGRHSSGLAAVVDRIESRMRVA